MLKFNSPRSILIAVAALLAVGLIFMALSGYLTPISRLLLDPLVTAQGWLSTRYLAIQDFVTAPADLARLRQRNAELEAENARLQAQVIELQQQLAEDRVLSALLDYVRANPQNQYVTASVIGRDTSPFLQYVIINRGSDHGLRRGMPVVTQQGLVGRVAAVAPAAARVQLLTDAATRVNVRLQQSGADAVLLGQVTGELSLDMIPQSSAVQVGELVLTSGLGGDYPENLLIGQVSGVRRLEAALFQTASVQPVVDFKQLRIVLVIVNFRPVDITPLLPTPSVP